ncbi:MAG: hypothetical protein B6240_15040 [Desulfobacteraceae bacterium 4572_87]|nr:MAG: hypothetical protein B6240_15040 [Desulfobacteraceae bacterium 4572_87]
MTLRLEIRKKDGLPDASGVGIQKKSKAYFGFKVNDVRVIRVLTIDAQFNADQRLRIQDEIFTNPITEESSYSPMQRDFDWLIWVGFRPGVRDTAGSTAREAIEDLLGVTFKFGEAVYTSKCFEIRGTLSQDQAHRIASELLANRAIHCITGETHNSPSNMEAYGGSITGIVGIYRDPMGTGKGSKLILGMYGYCVGQRDYPGPLEPHLHPRRLLDGIIEGVRDGGNKSGIPTPYGLLLFDESYTGKCLVFVTALGIMPSKVENKPSHKKTSSPGDLIVMSGGRVGKDGIHGVTASSETYSENTPASHVQIGDPYTQKKMHDFLLEVRDEGLIHFITDNGGGGLSSSVGESARFSNGCIVHLDKVPLKYEGLNQWEIWISESQERMTIAVKPEHLDRFMALSQKHAVLSTVIGEYTDSGFLHLKYNKETCAYIRMDLLESDFPQWEFDAEWVPPKMRGLMEPVITEPGNHGKLLHAMLQRPNICSRNWIARQYDHEVQGTSVIKPLVGKERDTPSDAAVIRPVLKSLKGLAVSQAINPAYSKIDTYHMTTATLDEAVRKVLAVGGDPDHLAGVDNFCWPTIEYHSLQNPDGKYKAAQLVRSNQALRDTCLQYSIPLLSGKDSMYIDGNLKGPFGERRKVSGLPTLLFTVSSVMPDITQSVSMDVKFPGDLIYVLGETRNELGGGEYYQMMEQVGINVPKVYPEEFLPRYMALHQAMKDERVSSCHAVARGGLAVHLALSAMGGALGMTVQLPLIPSAPGLSNTQKLYSESCGRFIITVAPELTDSPDFIITGENGDTVLKENIHRLKDSWKKPFGDLI